MARQSTGVLRQVLRSVAKGGRPEVTDRELLQRFAGGDDQEAFAALVARHGGMVLGVCRRQLPTVQDAEDAVQATFLVLARKAGTIRWQPSVANWLYTTARRVARDALVMAQRRARREARAAVPEAVQPSDSMTVRELLAILDRELDRLSPLYREPLVLCYLEGLTRDEAATRLGLPAATLRTRLDRGRKRLHDALTKSGCALGVGLLALAVTSRAGASPSRLVQAILATASGSVPEAVAELAKGVAVNGIAKRVSVILLAAVGIAALGLGLGSRTSPAGGQPPDKPAPPPAEKPQAGDGKANPDKPRPITVSGQVLDPDGKPAAGAEVACRPAARPNGDALAKMTTPDDGRFRLSITPDDPRDAIVVTATARGSGPDWAVLPNSGQGGEVTLRLTADDVPFTGRVANLENQPLKGVAVEVVRLGKPRKGDPATKDKLPAGFMEMQRQLKNVDLDEAKKLLRDLLFRKDSDRMDEAGLTVVAGELVLATTKTTTDADGKFRLTGLGRDRLLALRLHGPNLETKVIWGVTQTVEPKEAPAGPKLSLPGSTLLLAPSRPLVGTVRDAKTGKPVVGATVSELGSNVPGCATDEQGRYKIEGVKMKDAYTLIVTGAPGQPYFDGLEQRAVDTPGLGAVESHLTLDRGLELTGRVTDKATGRPVLAEVQYLPLEDNPNVKDLDRSRIRVSSGRTDREGRFTLTVWPGKGVIDVRADDAERYATVNAEKVLTQMGARRRLPGVVNALSPIDADPAKPGSLTVTVSLDEPPVLKGSVVGPDAKPLTGVTAGGLKKKGADSELATNEFTIVGLNSDSHHLLLFLHEAKKLGAVQAVSGAGTEPVVVKLQPLATAVGVVHKADKEPWAGLRVTALPRVADADKYENIPVERLVIQGVVDKVFAPWWPLTKRVVTTDAEGRFRLDGLVPGLEYTLYVSEGDLAEPDTLVTSQQKLTVTPGQALDLGVLKKGAPR